MGIFNNKGGKMTKENLKESIHLLKIMVNLFKLKNVNFIYNTVVSYATEEETKLLNAEYLEETNAISNLLSKLNDLKSDKNVSLEEKEINIILSSLLFYTKKHEEQMKIFEEQTKKLFPSKIDFSDVKDKLQKEYQKDFNSVKNLLNYLNIELI